MITSVNLAGIPFQSSTDSTRLQMASKQVQQTLTHINCDIPYIINNNYDKLTRHSELGICLAKDKGNVIFKNDDIIILNYNTDGIEIHEIPPIKKTHGIYSSCLRNALSKNTEFNAGDVIFEYDCFTNGIPSWGYNAFTAYNVFFGFNHEDSLVISESYSEKAKVTMSEKIYLPIYEYTLLDTIYNDPNDFVYFPGIGNKVQKKVLCQSFIPKTNDDELPNINSMKNRVIQLLRSMNIADYLNYQKSANINQFRKEVIKTKIKDGVISGFKIHKLNSKRQLIDKRLQSVLDKLYELYSGFIIDTYTTLTDCFDDKFSKQLLKRFYVYNETEDNKLDIESINVKECVYLLEFEIKKEDGTVLGDKFSNRYAGKGVVSLILPDELRPIALETNRPIDVNFNPFSVYSRMNIGQVLDGAIAKTVMYCDKYIKENPDEVKNTITWLNECIIKHMSNDYTYYNNVKENIVNNLDDEDFRKSFLDDINNQHLFIEGPDFSHIDMDNLKQNWVSPNESVLIKKKTIDYLKDKLKIKNDFVITNDIIRKNIFCVPMYFTKLYKLTKNIISSRDLGAVKDVTQQPTRGRALSGGSRLGQMEIEGLLSHGADLAVKEFLTVKSDHSAEKRNLLKQIVNTGEYDMPEKIESIGRTKRVVSTIINFLKE